MRQNTKYRQNYVNYHVNTSWQKENSTDYYKINTYLLNHLSQVQQKKKYPGPPKVVINILVMGRVGKSRVQASPSLKKSSPIESVSWLV